MDSDQKVSGSISPITENTFTSVSTHLSLSLSFAIAFAGNVEIIAWRRITFATTIVAVLGFGNENGGNYDGDRKCRTSKLSELLPTLNSLVASAQHFFASEGPRLLTMVTNFLMAPANPKLRYSSPLAARRLSAEENLRVYLWDHQEVIDCFERPIRQFAVRLTFTVSKTR